jgi:CRP-like cAMP-binding protein
MERRVTHSLVGALRAVPSLGTLDDRTLLAIVGDSANLFWRAGSQIFAKGSAADGLYIVLSGGVRVLDDGGAELGVLRSGDFFGELSLLHGLAHGNEVVAVEDTSCSSSPRSTSTVSSPRIPRSRGTSAKRPRSAVR